MINSIVHRSSKERGFALIIALMTIVILIAVALALLGHTTNAAFSYGGYLSKEDAFNVAEAGLNEAIDQLDTHTDPATPSVVPCPSGIAIASDNNVEFDCHIYDNFHGSGNSSPQTDPGPGPGKTIIVPKGYAFVYGCVHPCDGTEVHRTYVEALVKVLTISLNGFMNVGHDLNDNSHFNIQASPGGNCDANMYVNGNIFFNNAFKKPIIQGSSFAGGVDELPYPPNPNANPLSCGSANPNRPQPVSGLPSAGVFAGLAAEAKLIAQHGPLSPMAPAQVAGCTIITPCKGNIYVSGTVAFSGKTALEFAGGGTVYIDGDLCLTGQAMLENGGDSIWVAGKVKAGGSNSTGYLLVPGSTLGLLVSMAADSAATTCGGTTAIAISGSGSSQMGLVLAANANGSVTFNGGGSTPTALNGSIGAEWDVNLLGGSGSVALAYSPQNPCPFCGSGAWGITAYMEY